MPGQNSWERHLESRLVVESVGARDGTGRGAGPLHPRPPSLQVARRIQASGPRVLLAVVAGPALDAARARQGDRALLCPTLGPGVRPRLCHIVRDEGGFGFSVTHGERRGWGAGVRGPRPTLGSQTHTRLCVCGGGNLQNIKALSGWC